MRRELCALVVVELSLPLDSLDMTPKQYRTELSHPLRVHDGALLPYLFLFTRHPAQKNCIVCSQPCILYIEYSQL